MMTEPVLPPGIFFAFHTGGYAKPRGQFSRVYVIKPERP
jgi:hypothetical protein